MSGGLAQTVAAFQPDRGETRDGWWMSAWIEGREGEREMRPNCEQEHLFSSYYVPGTPSFLSPFLLLPKYFSQLFIEEKVQTYRKVKRIV